MASVLEVVFKKLKLMFITLSKETKQRYRENLKLMGGIGDSYFLWESSSPLVSYRSQHAVDRQKWPEVLIKTPSLCPKESQKAFKGLEYRLYSDG